MSGIKILGGGVYLPEKTVTNHDFEKIVDTSDEWIKKRTGIELRHVSDGEYTWSMGLKAAKKALKNSNLEPNDIDMIIVTTVSADFAYPSMSNVIQGELKATRAFGIDISCACAGFVYGLDMANRYINCGDDVTNVLIISTENITKAVDYKDRSTCVLFGDGAGAIVVTKGENKLYSYLATDGSGSRLIYAHLDKPSNAFVDKELAKENAKLFPNETNGRMFMDGRETYKFAVSKMPEALEKACSKAGIKPSDLDVLIPHQANLRIIETAVKNLNMDFSKVCIKIQKLGNISSACIPVCFSELIESGEIKRGDKVGLVGFGSGLIYGANVFTF